MAESKGRSVFQHWLPSNELRATHTIFTALCRANGTTYTCS